MADDDDQQPFNVNDLLQLLCQIVIEKPAILGFYASGDRQRVLVDIEHGHTHDIQHFFHARCPQYWQAQRLVLVEQEYQAEPLCHAHAHLQTLCRA